MIRQAYALAKAIAAAAPSELNNEALQKTIAAQGGEWTRATEVWWMPTAVEVLVERLNLGTATPDEVLARIKTSLAQVDLDTFLHTPEPRTDPQNLPATPPPAAPIPARALPQYDSQRDAQTLANAIWEIKGASISGYELRTQELPKELGLNKERYNAALKVLEDYFKPDGVNFLLSIRARLLAISPTPIPLDFSKPAPDYHPAPSPNPEPVYHPTPKRPSDELDSVPDPMENLVIEVKITDPHAPNIALRLPQKTTKLLAQMDALALVLAAMSTGRNPKALADYLGETRFALMNLLKKLQMRELPGMRIPKWPVNSQPQQVGPAADAETVSKYIAELPSTSGLLSQKMYDAFRQRGWDRARVQGALNATCKQNGISVGYAIDAKIFLLHERLPSTAPQQTNNNKTSTSMHSNGVGTLNTGYFAIHLGQGGLSLAPLADGSEPQTTTGNYISIRPTQNGDSYELIVPVSQTPGARLREVLEKKLVQQVFEHQAGHITRTAHRLGVGFSTARKRLVEYGLLKPETANVLVAS